MKLGTPAAAASGLDDALDREETVTTVRGDARYTSFWKIWMPLVAAFVLLDLTFDLYFWRIPKLNKPNADYGYQFMLDAQPLWQLKAADSRRVLALGSSVALSFDTRQVESLLAVRPQGHFDVHRLLLPGIHPSDYLMFFRGKEMAQPPDAVIVLVNLVDFLYPNTERDVNPTLRFILPPWRLLAQRHEHMSITSELDTILAGSSRLYRYRKLVRSSLHEHARALLRWLRSSPPPAPYGIYPDGYTKQVFALPAAAGGQATIEYFIDPEWLRQRGRVGLRFTAAGKVLATREELEAGWKSVAVDVPPSSDGWIEVAADSAWTPRASGQEDSRLLAVLLRQPPAGAQADGARPFRYRSVVDGEIDGFLRMGGATGDDFARRWKETLEGETRFGERFRLYRDAKLELTGQPFVSGGEYEAVRELVEHFRALGSSVIVINTPESPWILDEYRERPYYQGYLGFLRELAASTDGVRFYDWSDALPPEDFNDWHHPSYIGAIKLGSRYADAVTAALTVDDSAGQ